MTRPGAGPRVHLALAAVSVIFGSNYVVAKVVMDDVPPMALFAVRTAGASLCLYLLHRIWIHESLQRRDLLPVAVYSFFGVVVNQILFLWGLERTTPTNAAILVCTIPAFTYGWAVLLRREPAVRIRLIGLAIAFLGVGYLIGIEEFDLSSELVQGNLFIVINSSSFGLYLVLTKPLVSRYRNPVTVLRWTFAFAMLAIPFSIPALSRLQAPAFSPTILVAIGFMILFPTVLTYLLNNWALQRADASLVAVYIYLQPIVAASLSIAFLGEQLTLRMLPAVVAVFLGVFCVTRPTTRLPKRDVTS